jgi:PhoPQ-activated pathogenicity-related protein
MKTALSRTACLLLASLGVAAASERTALDRYVASPDLAYRYQLATTLHGGDHTAYVLDMTSQSWRSPCEVNRVQWQHWLTIIKPDRITSSTGLLFIGGGANGRKPPARADGMLLTFAKATGAVVAELQMVPNQPLQFPDDKMEKRVEDELIAYTWDKFLKGADELWPAQLPMTKSAVRAMDTVTAFCQSPQGGSVKVDRFVVSGASKRGWTTWLTAVVDERVVAVMPIVIDMLNLEPSFVHHWQVYGFWAPAVKDYVDMGIMRWMGKPEFKALMKLVEPYEYRDRFTMPKYLVNAAGDQFFLPDSSQFYFDDLPGEKYLRYVPNTDHSLARSDAGRSLLAFFESVLTGKPRPEFSWKLENDRSIRVTTTDRPREVKLWQATNPNARDFRLETIGRAWKARTLRGQGGGVYVGSVAPPPKGWTAFFLEMTYPSTGKYPFKFTTQVRVVPDTLPFPPPRAE